MPKPAVTTEKTPVKRAKTLADEDVRRIAFDLHHEEHGLRSVVAFYLSYYCALRACEIARLEWKNNVLDAKGKIAKRLTVSGGVAKRGGGGELDIPTPLRHALTMLREARPRDRFVFYPLDNRNIARPYEAQTGLKPNSVVQFFTRLYDRFGYDGLSSHSGRRSAITKFSRVASQSGKHSFLDVVQFARHKQADTTLAYIEPNEDRAAIIESLWDDGEISDARRILRERVMEPA